MRKQILFGVLASVGVAILSGCSSDTDKPTSAADKKSFAGGPMPADFQKKFQEGQSRSGQAMADRIAKAKASAMAGK